MEVTKNILYQISNQFSFSIIPDVIVGFKYVFLYMLVGYVIHWLPSSVKEIYRGWFVKSNLWLQGLIVIVVVFVLYQTRTAGIQPFIYFQF